MMSLQQFFSPGQDLGAFVVRALCVDVVVAYISIQVFGEPIDVPFQDSDL